MSSNERLILGTLTMRVFAEPLPCAESIHTEENKTNRTKQGETGEIGAENKP